MELVMRPHILLFLFVAIFGFLFYLLVRDKIYNKNKTFVKVKKIKKTKDNLVQSSNSNDTGVIFISKPIKPYGIKEEKTHEIKNKQNIKKVKYNGIFDLSLNVDKFKDNIEVIVKGDQAFVEIVTVNFNNDFIEIIHPQITCSYNIDCYIQINIPSLDYFNNKGMGIIDIKNIESKSFTFFNNGRDDVSLSGFVDKLKIYSKSKSDLFAQKLIANDAFIENNGIGDVYCHVKNNIETEINFNGNVYLKDFNVNIKNKENGDGYLIYRPFEDSILNFIFISFQTISKKIKIKKGNK